ncbi:MAG: ankyrin repeat domain-containing protein [Crocinitomicaceae bacterium]|nr:ankyrin repeat domain-containing protein [Flavobacteriales bacterium]NQZ37914.1 ankyrin repeat domain-containing protein [Crocinitomicaceae bacterium]
MKRCILPFLFLFVFSGFAQETSPLILAIQSNNLAQVKTLVASGADINELDENYDSPLKVAIRKENLAIVKFLIESNAEDRGGISEAVRKDNIKLTKYLIEQKFYLGESIVYAAEKNNLEMVKLLASNGAKVDFSQKRRKGLFRKYYVSPINKAVYHNNLAMVNVLIKHGLPLKTALKSSLNSGKNDIILALSKDLEDKSWLLMEAFSRSNDPIVKKLIAEGVPPNAEDEEGNSMLLIAAAKGNLISVTRCVEVYKLYIYKKNNAGENALMKATNHGSRQVCTYLLEKGITVDAQNNKGETALFYALSDESRSVFDFLIENGADINHKSLDGNTLLTKAAIRDQKNTMTYLISLKADINHKNKENKTAFYYVVANSRGYSSNENEIQNTFIQAGADINTRGNSGETLLFMLIERGKFDRITELVSLGANANTQDRNGERPSCKETEIIKFLIEKGADINATDSWDNTFMCEAVKQNDIELAYFLVNKGINVNKRCYFNEQAIIKAIKAENSTLVQFLAENGADLNALGYGRKNVMDYAQEVGDGEIISYLRSRGAMTKEERNAQYKASIKLESEIKASLIAEDLEAVISLMATQDVIILQEKVVQNIAYVASKKGHTQMMNKLLSDDIDFSIDSPVNSMGQTALFIATIYGQNDLVLDLLAKGANLNHLDKKGKSASDYVSKKSTKKIFKKWSKSNKL